MGLIGAAAGALLGIVLQLGLPNVLADFLPVDVSVSVEPTAVGMGLLVGLWVALVFALRPLIALRNVSPLQTLRRESDADALRGALVRSDPRARRARDRAQHRRTRRRARRESAPGTGLLASPSRWPSRCSSPPPPR